MKKTEHQKALDTPNQRWKSALQQQVQIEDDRLAQKYAQDTFHVINVIICNCMQAIHLDAERLQLWLNKGINFISCRDNEHCLRNIEVGEYYFNESRWLPKELQASLNRYLELYNSIVFLRKLSAMGLVLTLDNLLNLSSESKLCLQKLPASRKETMSLLKWTFAMADNITQFNKLLQLCPDFNDFEFFIPYSCQQVSQYLDLLLKGSNSAQIKSRHESLKLLVSPGSNFEQVKQLLTTPFLFKQSRRETIIQMQPFLQNLSSASKKHLFSMPVTTDLLNFLKELSSAAESTKRIDLILSSAYLLSGKPRIHSPIISYVLKTKLSDSRLQSIFCTADAPMIALRAVVFSAQGIECHTKDYCNFSSQLDLEISALPMLHEVMLHRKQGLTPDSLKVLSSPEMLSAFEAKFFDIGYIAACKPKELKEIAMVVKKARAIGIRDIWDPRFSKLINKTVEQTFFDAANPLPEKKSTTAKNTSNQNSKQHFFKPPAPAKIVAVPRKSSGKNVKERQALKF